jgi:hypothetical protein
MDKNKIKNHLVNRFVNEGTPGIDITRAVLSKSKAFNDEGLKDIEDKLKDADKGQKKSASKTKEMPQNKFNYNNNKEAEYHQEMEIMNGSEMLEYDRDPNQSYKDRAEEAIVGSARMGNSPEYANVFPEQMGFTGPTFGKKLVQAIKNSAKKRLKATDSIISFGDDIETVSKNYAPMAKFSALNESEGNMVKEDIDRDYTHFFVFKKNNKIVDGFDYSETYPEDIKFYAKQDLKDNDFYPSNKYPENKASDFALVSWKKLQNQGIDPYDIKNWYTERYNEEPSDNMKGLDSDYEKDSRGVEYGIDPYNENKTNNKPQIKEGMKRLKFKQEFKGVGNALKLIPESYKVDNKVFEMTDGVESYRMRWEGNLNEGRAVVLMASDKTMVNEDMQKMKHLMGYKSQETLGAVKGKARIDENKIFTDIWKKSQILVEGEDIEAQKAPEKKTDEKLPQAPEARKHVHGSVEKKVEMEISDKSETETEFDKVDVPQAAEAKKHVSETKGIKLGESYFAPMDEAWMEEMMHGGMEEGMYEDEESYDDEEEDTRIDYSMGKTGPNQMPAPPKSIKLDIGSMEEGMYEEGMYEEGVYEEGMDEMYSLEESDDIDEMDSMYNDDEE